MHLYTSLDFSFQTLGAFRRLEFEEVGELLACGKASEAAGKEEKTFQTRDLIPATYSPAQLIFSELDSLFAGCGRRKVLTRFTAKIILLP